MANISTVSYSDLTGTIYQASGVVLGNKFIKVILDNTILPQEDYEIINNAVVFETSPIGSTLTIETSTDEDFLNVPTSIYTLVGESQDKLEIVAADIESVNTVANGITKVVIVSDNIEDVTTVASVGQAGLQGIVANSNNISTVASIYTKVESVASIAPAVTTVSANIASVTTVSGNIDKVQTVAINDANITTVADNIATVASVVNNSTNITTTANNITSINTVASNTANINTVSGNIANVNSVAGNMASVTAVNSNSSNINTVASNNTNINTTATNIADVNTVASNIVNVNAFSNTYKISSTAPTSPFEGMLWWDTVSNVLKEYDGSSWIAVTSDMGAVDDYLGSLITEVLV